MNINDLNSLLQFDFVRPTKIKVQKDEHRVLPDNLKNDVFEKSQKPFEIQIKHTCPKSTATKNINVTINPLDKGTIYKKVLNNKTGKTEKVPMQVDIAKSQEKTGVSYYFLNPENHEEIGFVVIDDWQKARRNYLLDFDATYNSKLLEDYPELGILGDRISIYYLQNNEESKYCGIGKLADRIAIEYCLQEGIEPNIISLADTNSHVAHYKRGRRFLPVTPEDTINYRVFLEKYGTDDPNKIIEARIAAAIDGQKVDTTDLSGLYMYMPQEIIDKYIEEIKKNPTLH